MVFNCCKKTWCRKEREKHGCDASLLLDDTDDTKGEKTAAPNLNSLRRFEVIDAVKTDHEAVCPETVSVVLVLTRLLTFPNSITDQRSYRKKG